ncbi:MAG: proline--tRNA ligase [Actinomycetota bacterium]|nr:proline--tRNA ligase [Actinomycetota bacterium]
MIARASQLFLPTLRDAPADAEALSHKLLVRGGFIRQVSAGLWTFLPLGWRVHRKVEQIVREELDAIGAQEMFAPVVTPADLWIKTGRYNIPELFKLQDRNGRDFVLPLTHEETFTFHALELQSYRQLPQSWYHFQTKDRDEPRPRGGLLRVREFVMKDSYSFDRDEAVLETSFRAHEGAYERIFERCGLETHSVLAESGMMGGSESFDYLAPSGSGENTLVRCENGDYAADLEIARGIPRVPEFPGRLDAPAEIETPDTRTCEALAALLSIDLGATSKAMPVMTADGTLVLALLRGDDRLEEAKLQAALGSDYRPAKDDEILAGFGAEGGSLGPVGFAGPIAADESLRDGQFVAGANRTGWHLRGVEAGRDFQAEFVDIRQPKEGDACPVCGGRLSFQTAIEVGHIFKLGTRFSEALGAKYLDEDGVEKQIVMGSYGIGPGRVLAAAVEQHGSDDGMVWPAEIAPYDVHVVVLGWDNPELVEIGEQAAESLSAEGLDVLLDDRDLRPGEKFADADLIGCPVRVTVGKKSLADDAVDVRRRATGEEERVARLELGKRVVERG